MCRNQHLAVPLRVWMATMMQQELRETVAAAADTAAAALIAPQDNQAFVHQRPQRHTSSSHTLFIPPQGFWQQIPQWPRAFPIRMGRTLSQQPTTVTKLKHISQLTTLKWRTCSKACRQEMTPWPTLSRSSMTPHYLVVMNAADLPEEKPATALPPLAARECIV